MEKQQVSYWELEGTYQEIGKQMAKQPEKNHIYIPAPEKFGCLLYTSSCCKIHEINTL